MTGEEAVEASLGALAELLTFSQIRQHGHVTIKVEGCEEDCAIEHIGRFLVGAIAQAIATDLQLQPVLLSPGFDGQEELKRDVEKLIGAEGEPLTDHARTHERDPWIGEALGQLLLVLSGEAPHPCVPAPVVAAHLPHVEPKEHGLDLFAFGHPELIVLIGEAKTSKAQISNGLRSAEAMFNDIEEGLRDHDVRRAVNALQTSLEPDVRAGVVGAFWKRSRGYAPVLCFQSGLNPVNERESLKALVEAEADCRMLVMQFADHDEFFKKAAQAMRDAVPIIAPA